MFQIEAPLVGRRQVARDMWVAALGAPEVAAVVLPGQFVNLGLGPDLMLRRPFSVYGTTGDSIEVLFKVVGRGTRRLHELAIGDLVSVLGPLGRGFQLPPSSSRIAVLSGGLGVAAMRLPAEHALRSGSEVAWVHGARTAADLCAEWTGSRVIWATEDGSRGAAGNVLTAMDTDDFDAVLACGPNRMLKAVAERWPAAQVALETYMGCGTGVCLGCAVPLAAGGYDRSCQEGPVYRAGQVDWDRLPSQLHYSVA